MDHEFESEEIESEETDSEEIVDIQFKLPQDENVVRFQNPVLIIV
jgi:hypothetical protein